MPEPHRQRLFPDFPARFSPKGSVRLLTKPRGICPAACPTARCRRGFGAWGVSVLLSLLPSSWQNVYSFHQLLVGRDCRRFRSSVASILTAWRERKPHRCPQSQCPPPSFGMNPPLHAAGPPPVKTSCCLGGPQSAAPISAPPETCVLCKGTLDSFTPTINFSLVAACSTDKAQPISYCLPGFEDGITELQFCLSGIQGKKRGNENTMHFPVNCEGKQ